MKARYQEGPRRETNAERRTGGARSREDTRFPTTIFAVRHAGSRSDGLGRFQPKAPALAEVARDVLRGRLAMLEGRAGDAIAFYRRAATLQDDELDGIADPPIFWYPVRRSLAAALLSEGRTADAAQEAKKVLVRWVGDPLSERILADVDAATGRPAQAQRWLEGTRVHWNGDVAAVPLALL